MILAVLLLSRRRLLRLVRSVARRIRCCLGLRSLLLGPGANCISFAWQFALVCIVLVEVDSELRSSFFLCLLWRFSFFHLARVSK